MRTPEPREALSAAVRRRIPQLGRDFAHRLAEVAPEYYELHATDFQQAGWAALRVVAEGACDCLDSPQGRAEHFAAELRLEAVAAARNGLDWETLARSYALTHQMLWETAVSETGGLGLRSDALAHVLTETTQAWFAYFDFLHVSARRSYTEAQADLARKRQHVRSTAVRQLLDGVAGVDESRLGYPLTRWNVGVVASGAGVEQLVAAAARRLQAEVMVLPQAEDHVWGWLACRGPVHGPALEEAFGVPPHGWIAVGSPLKGAAGFTRSHREAQAVASVCARRLVDVQSRVVQFDDVAMQIVALESERTARLFVEHELAPLLASDSRSAELRQTVLAYGWSGMNATAAGRRLGVAERTVRYRLARLEELFGRDLRERWPRLVLAVSLFDALEHQWAGDGPSRPSG